jgi:hypothetical protein
LTDAVPSEHFEQRELVKWFRQTFKGVRIFAIPNGGVRSLSTAAKLKALSLIHISEPTRQIH